MNDPERMDRILRRVECRTWRGGHDWVIDDYPTPTGVKWYRVCRHCMTTESDEQFVRRDAGQPWRRAA